MSVLITVIMPAYNAQAFIKQAVDSVIAQTMEDWELVIVNDGSTDGTANILRTFNDPRIRIIHRANGGIGSARNVALEMAKGQFISFLDADDMLTPDSLRLRARILLDDPNVDIADGRMLEMDALLKQPLRTFAPTFTGEPFHEILKLTGSCFGGVTWMLRWPVDPPVKFQEHSSQMEDLMFILAYSHPGRKYAYTTEYVLKYRRTRHSSTSDLRGMERSYRVVHQWLTGTGWVERKDLRAFRRRSRKVMVASWLHALRPLRALRSAILPFR